MKKLIIVIPAYNEEEILEKNIIKLQDFCKKNIKNYSWKIIISNNNSIDKTLDIAKKLSKKFKQVSYVSWKDKAKGLSIKKTWLSNEADIYSYMDADLSTEVINHFPELIDSLEKGCDIAIGSRIIEKKSFKRKIVSKVFVLILKIVFQMSLKDSQCGFKIINKKVRDNIIPKMKSLNYGFMDTEMLIVANEKGYKIKEIPVSWQETRKSRINLYKDIFDTIKNIIRFKKDLILGNYN